METLRRCTVRPGRPPHSRIPGIKRISDAIGLGVVSQEQRLELDQGQVVQMFLVFVDSGQHGERAERALDAGCDVLPVCNHRPSAIAVIEGLKAAPDPVAALRRVRLRGRPQQDIEALRASDRWRMAQQALERCTAPPDLRLA
jgi:hypothetical protein